MVGLNIPTGIPLVYDLDDDLKPIEIGGRYLTSRPLPHPSKPSRCRAGSKRASLLRGLSGGVVSHHNRQDGPPKRVSTGTFFITGVKSASDPEGLTYPQLSTE